MRKIGSKSSAYLAIDSLGDSIGNGILLRSGRPIVPIPILHIEGGRVFLQQKRAFVIGVDIPKTIINNILLTLNII